MLIVTARQMKAIEETAQTFGLGMERLMENAGSAAAAVIRRDADVEGRYVTLFCGRGNNGGDGFVAARRLLEAGVNAAVILTDGEPESEQARAMFELLRETDITVANYGDDSAWLADRLAMTDILVDAIYGTGFHGELDERHRDICRLINGVEVPTYALDIPSGVCADTGAADLCAVRADVTVVFDSDKPATVFPAAERWCGEVVLADIGIPSDAHAGMESAYTLVNRDWVFANLPKRIRESHKGTYGKLLNAAGSQCYMGAAILSTLAAMRSGAGYVTLASTKEVCRCALPLLPEAVLLPLRQTAGGSVSPESMETILDSARKSTAVLAGNGLGTEDGTAEIIYQLIKSASCPLILDADGINAVSRNIDILRQAVCPLILTPHLMEFSRLTGLSVEQLSGDILTAGLSFAQEYQVTLVLKDAYTYTVTPQGRIFINTTGNAGLAKAGSGDVLAGIIASLAAQGRAPEIAAACGVWLHGMAGDYAARECSQYAMLARDVLDALPAVLRDYDR